MQAQHGFTFLSCNTLGMSTLTHFAVLWIFISRTQCCYGVPFRHGYFISFFSFKSHALCTSRTDWGYFPQTGIWFSL